VETLRGGIVRNRSDEARWGAGGRAPALARSGAMCVDEVIHEVVMILPIFPRCYSGLWSVCRSFERVQFSTRPLQPLAQGNSRGVYVLRPSSNSPESRSSSLACVTY
jgi:hypothetical protein